MGAIKHIAQLVVLGFFVVLFMAAWLISVPEKLLGERIITLQGRYSEAEGRSHPRLCFNSLIYWASKSPPVMPVTAPARIPMTV